LFFNRKERKEHKDFDKECFSLCFFAFFAVKNGLEKENSLA